jgi:hypothetical protein
MQKFVQEEKTMTGIASVFRQMLVILAWAFLTTSWFGIVAALRSFVMANRDYGFLKAETFLDAGFGYYGLSAFGAAAVAVLLAARGYAGPKQRRFLLFKLTFLLSLLFLVPMLYSMVAFLVNLPALGGG